MNQDNVKPMYDTSSIDSVGLYWSGIVTGTFFNLRLTYPEAIKSFNQNYYQEFNALLTQVSVDFAQNWVDYRNRITSGVGTGETRRFASAGGSR
jgi:hypothetical protein